MIRGIHAMFFTPKADEARAFFKDKLQIHSTDVGEGWLVFGVKEGEIGCHPDETARHDISLYCDDIESEVATLTDRGVEFAGPIEDAGWGRMTTMLVPGGLKVGLYQPRYKKS